MPTIWTAFSMYLDGNNLYAPNPLPPGTKRGSDNGPLFTSQVLIIRFRNGEGSPAVAENYVNAIQACKTPDGHIHRAPGDLSEDAPDDYYGVVSGFVEIDQVSHIKLPLALWRQPQLLFAVMASNKTLSRWKFWQWPLAIYTSLVVLTSCIGAERGDTDSRILAWHLIQATKKASILVRLASAVWYNRLFSIYPNGMKDVAAIYFQPNELNQNPYSKYWVTK